MSVLKFYNRDFIISLQTPYIDTGSNLPWVKPAKVKLVTSIRETVKTQRKRKILKVLISTMI